MNQKVMHLQNLYDFSLVRFQPNSIVLLDKNTRQPYEFYQIDHLQNIHPQLSHPSLLRPILYKNGVLYAQACSTLSGLLQFKRRDYIPIKYTSQQIINTFQPILQCLQYLHEKGISYGNLSSDHISFFQNGQIMMKDWFFKRMEKDIFNKANKLKDMKDLGLIIAESATLIPYKQISKLSTVQIISIIIEWYEQNFCVGIIILLEGLEKYYSLILGVMSNEISDYKMQEIKIIIENAIKLKNRKQKEKIKQIKYNDIKNKLKEVENQKQVITQKKYHNNNNNNNNNNEQNKYQPLIQNYSIQSSPIKKFIISTPNKKLINLQDNQNKKIFNEQIKKKQIQKITKIIQRSNAFVNQLIARKNHDKKFFNNKINTTIFDTQENFKKTTFIKQSPKITSPMKRMRSISKKK